MKKAFKIGGLVLLTLFLIFGTTIGIKVMSGLKEVHTLAAQEIIAPDLVQVPDGTWRGKVEWGVLAVVVDVTVQAGEITAIQILQHDHGKGGKGEEVIDNILEAQSINIDAISGATLSSKAILNAVADALTRGTTQ